MHGEMTGSNDHAWAEVARGARRALAEVGYPEPPACMPDEAEPCGGTAQFHALAYFAVLQAVAEHQLDHLGANPSVVADIQLEAAAELTVNCQGVHQ
jgi:hypothetical protein